MVVVDRIIINVQNGLAAQGVRGATHLASQFRLMDADGSGKLTLEEFSRGISACRPPMAWRPCISRETSSKSLTWVSASLPAPSCSARSSALPQVLADLVQARLSQLMVACMKLGRG